MIHVITGPPCSGKTTYISDNKKDGDVVIDLDAIAYAMGGETRQDYNDDILNFSNVARYAVIDKLLKQPPERDAWLIHCDPNEKALKRYSEAGCTVETMDPGADTCLKRAEAAGRPERTAAVIKEWYQKRGLHSAQDGGLNSPQKGRNAMDDETLENGAAEDGKGAAAPPDNNAGKSEETDWEAKYKEAIAQSRKWEKMARADHKNAAAEKGNAADAIARAEAAERELANMKAEKARGEMIATIAAEKGVDASILARMTGDKREDIEANADMLSGIPKPNSYQTTKGVQDKGEPAPTPGKSYEDIRDIKRQSDRIKAMLENPGAVLNQ